MSESIPLEGGGKVEGKRSPIQKRKVNLPFRFHKKKKIQGKENKSRAFGCRGEGKKSEGRPGEEKKT